MTIIPLILWYHMIIEYIKVRYPRSYDIEHTISYNPRISHNSPFLPKSKAYIHQEFRILFCLHRLYLLWILELGLLLYHFLLSKFHLFQSSQTSIWALSHFWMHRKGGKTIRESLASLANKLQRMKKENRLEGCLPAILGVRW